MKSTFNFTSLPIFFFFFLYQKISIERWDKFKTISILNWINRIQCHGFLKLVLKKTITSIFNNYDKMYSRRLSPKVEVATVCVECPCMKNSMYGEEIWILWWGKYEFVCLQPNIKKENLSWIGNFPYIIFVF